MAKLPDSYEPRDPIEKMPEFTEMMLDGANKLFEVFNTLPFPFRHIIVILLAVLVGYGYVKLRERWTYMHRNDRGR